MNYDLSRFLLAICLGLCLSCTDNGIIDQEEMNENTVETEINKWVYDRMKHYYLWYDQLPEEKTLQYGQDPSSFFYSLLADDDGKNGALYSRIEYDESLLRASSQDDKTYGFEYRLIRVAGRDELIAQILYVYKNSPAADAGLKRGELILSINGNPLTSSNYADYLDNPQTAAEMQMGEMVSSTHFCKSRLVKIEKPTSIKENPIYMDTVIHIQNRNIAYLMYNSFDEDFDDDLRMAFRKFKEQQADEFILDLRYNHGGSVSCAQLLATMLIPKEYLGKEFVYLKYNELINKQEDILFDKSIIGRGVNMDLSHLYIITGNETASASEAIINGIRPYLNANLIQVGETTFGKNVGQILLTNEKWQSLEVWPTAFYLFNSEDYGDYSEGLRPDIECQEGLQIGELATPDDPLFSAVLSIMNGNGQMPATLRSDNGSYEIVHSSLSRKRPLAYYR